jgi:hypothetical protein
LKFTRLLVCSAAAVAALAIPAFAQQTSPGFHTAACFKVKPENGDAYRKYVEDEVQKVGQARVDDGELTSWYFLRAVFPQGASAECDYLIIAFFPNAPHALGNEQLQAAITKAGLKITPDDYKRHRDALSTVVSLDVFRNVTYVGAPKKGDYFEVNYMRVTDANFDDWVAFEQKTWKPLAEAMVKDGVEDGWSVNIAAMPFGADLPYQGVTVDVYPSLDAVFADDAHFDDRFRKVHADLDPGLTFEQAEKLRTRSQVRLFSLDYMAAAH